MNDEINHQRAAAEEQYSITAHDYVSNPIGSRDWTIYWRGWQAAVELDRQQRWEPVTWFDGEPPFPQNQEWFIAETTYGDRVVLRALPEEYSYDFTTADGTYIKADKIARWIQFPDCEYLPPQPSEQRGEPTVADGMAILKAAIAADPDYAWSWHCAVWAAAYDEGLETGAANRAAARLMRAAFDVDTTKNTNFDPAHLAVEKEQQ